jgi:hypothetical protein
MGLLRSGQRFSVTENLATLGDNFELKKAEDGHGLYCEWKAFDHQKFLVHSSAHQQVVQVTFPQNGFQIRADNRLE